jgi:acetyl coenzyme A synthetase (ADP forming)-like protein
MSSRGLLAPFFAPRSVAVVGASPRVSSVGHAILRNLLYGRAHGEAGPKERARGFQGPIYAVNPRGGQILGEPVFESLTAIGADIDLVLCAIPPRAIPDLMDEAGALKIPAVVVISAGFSEIGAAGLALQDEMLARAKRHGIRLIGPNCLGVMRPSQRLNASFAATSARAGSIALLSQSGALITGIISYAEREAFGLSAAVSLGAKADVSDAEVLDFFAADEETKAVALYVEGFNEPRAAFEALRRLARNKPVVALKGGQSAAGAKAATSHTGALAGSAAAYRAAFLQSGALMAEGVGDFLAYARTLAMQPAAAGDRIAIVTNAGGPGVLSADEAGRCGLTLARLSDETMQRLNVVLPSVWSKNNPIDVIGDATPERYRAALNILGQAEEVDGILTITTVQAMTAPLDVAKAIVAACKDPTWQKPLVSSFFGLVGTDTGSYLDEHCVPELNTPEEAVRAMGALVRRGRFLRPLAAPESHPITLPEPDIPRARQRLAEAMARGQTNLDLELARGVLEAAGVRYNRSGRASDEEHAVRVARQLGYPVVLKLISPDVVHKSDAGGVVLDVASDAQVREACGLIKERVLAHHPEARITGFTVEEQVKGTEIIVGVFHDDGFGPLLMVGMGGVFVEVYRDVSFRLLPIERKSALAMMDEIKAQALLDGARGRPMLDREELAEVLVRISRLVEELPEVAEIDVNPLVLTERGLIAIDARVIVRSS